jgi:signal peptidase II
MEFVLNRYKLFAFIFIFSTVLDQITKIWVMYNIRGPRVVNGVNLLEVFNIELSEWREMPSNIDVIPGFFSIVHTQNAGAAFGIMQGQMFVFALFTLMAIGVICWMLVQLPEEERFQNVALALLASGTIGNGIDRFHKQCVTDFLHVYSENPTIEPILINVLGSNSWPSFNVADAAIVIGMLMFGFHYLFLEKDEEVEPDPPKDAVQDIT